MVCLFFADDATESVSSPLIKNIDISSQNCANIFMIGAEANRMIASADKRNTSHNCLIKKISKFQKG